MNYGTFEKFNVLGLHLVELVDLFAHFGDGIVVLLAQVGQSRLVLDVGFLQVATQFAQFSLAFLVEFDLSGGGSTGFLQTLAQFLEFAGQIGALLLGLGAGLAFSLELFLELLNARLQFLDLLLQFGDQRLLILELGVEGGNLLVLALDGLFQFLLVAFQIGNSFLGQFQVSLSLALVLLNVGADQNSFISTQKFKLLS